MAEENKKDESNEMDCCGSGECSMYGYCKCLHHNTLPVLGLLFGLLFLLNNLGYWVTDSLLGIAWPSLVIIASLFILTESKCRCC